MLQLKGAPSIDTDKRETDKTWPTQGSAGKILGRRKPGH